MKKLRFKGFDQNLCCTGMQFEIGEEYKIDNNGQPLELCSETVFHYCKHLEDVFDYYSPWEKSRYCLIEVLGEEIHDESKYGSAHIRILREVHSEELEQAMFFYFCDFDPYIYENYLNEGDGNTGDYNTGDENTGNYNIGSRNTGRDNEGVNNSGDNNIGIRNAGNDNIGDWNTGFRNFGSFNTGLFNRANGTCGVFCTTDDSEIRLFNKPSSMSLKEFKKTTYWKALTQSDFCPYQGCRAPNVTDKYKEACKLWWEGTSDKNKEIILSMPNFDAGIFEEITGIRV